MAAAKVPNTPESWENGALGREEKFVEVASPSHEAALDEALGLQAISIRLPKQLIDQYKLIAHFHHVGYQPLMRDVLQRFAPDALKEILDEEQFKAKATAAKHPPLFESRKKVA